MKRYLVISVLCLAFVGRIFAFGGEGHRSIALIALSKLSPAAKAAIEEILDGESIADAAMWPDEIKPPYGRLATTPEARSFNQRHRDNKKWHYVNFPIGSKRYSPSSPFAYPHDIVQTINGCIAVLEGGTYENLTEKEALRYLIHLVGDIHQPMHVVSGYYDLTDLTAPKLQREGAEIDRDTSDGGGNSLLFGSSNMHTMWDTTLVNDVFPTNDPAKLAEEVMKGVASIDAYKTAGAHTTWAAKWAADSMKIAAPVYADIEFGTATLAHDNLKSIAVTLKPDDRQFRAKYAATAKEQLRKGGAHLAQLLNSIKWERAQ